MAKKPETVYVRNAAKVLHNASAFSVTAHDAHRAERLHTRIAETIGASHSDLRQRAFTLYAAGSGAPVRTNAELDAALAAVPRGHSLWLRYEIGTGRTPGDASALPAENAALVAAATAAATQKAAAEAEALSSDKVRDALCAKVASLAVSQTPGASRNAKIVEELSSIGAALYARLGATNARELASAVARDVVHSVATADKGLSDVRDSRARQDGYEKLLRRDPAWKRAAAMIGGAMAPRALDQSRMHFISGAAPSAWMAAPTTKLDSFVVVVQDRPTNFCNTMEGRSHVRERGYSPITSAHIGCKGGSCSHPTHHRSSLWHDGDSDSDSDHDSVLGAAAHVATLGLASPIGCHMGTCSHKSHKHKTVTGSLAHDLTLGTVHKDTLPGAALDAVTLGTLHNAAQIGCSTGTCAKIGCPTCGKHKKKHYDSPMNAPIGCATGTCAQIGCKTCGGKKADKDRRPHHHHDTLAGALLHSGAQIGDSDLMPLSCATGTCAQIGCKTCGKGKKKGHYHESLMHSAAPIGANIGDSDLVPIGDKCHGVPFLCDVCHLKHAKGMCAGLGALKHPHKMPGSPVNNLLYAAAPISAAGAASATKTAAPISAAGAASATKTAAPRYDDDLVPFAAAQAVASPQRVGTGRLVDRHATFHGLMSSHERPSDGKAMLVISNAMWHRHHDDTVRAINITRDGTVIATIEDGKTKPIYVDGGVGVNLGVSRGGKPLAPEHTYTFEPNHIFPAFLTSGSRSLEFGLRVPRIDAEIFGAKIGARVEVAAALPKATISLVGADGRDYKLSGDSYTAVPSDARFLRISTPGGQAVTNKNQLALLPGKAHTIGVYLDANGDVAVHAQCDVDGTRVAEIKPAATAATPSQGKRAINFNVQ